ncbi:MAG: hypothetical protein IJY25_05155 [Bacilli bacterium]|nr:hypothetical protein [Bacilli bacterium]
MYTLSINMWFQKLMKQFFFGIDQIVYNFISQVYDLLISIARTSILSQADILDMADRVYKLLAVFMIFKVTFSLITYVVNPDDFSDKSKGVAKLGTNIVISLALLILTPYIFNYAYRLQTIILEDNSLAALIFGDTDKEGSSAKFLNTAGDEMAFITMSAFFTPNVSIDEIRSCIDLKDESGDGFNPNCSGLNKDYNVIDEKNKNNLVGVVGKDKTTIIQNYVAGVEHHNLGLMFRAEMAVATTENDEFIMDYKYIFSTIVGVVLVLLLITFCMDVGLRSIKLSFLQLIAPIPIISYVDPKSGKDGMFKKWYQMCFKTYLSLFIRLLAIYFAIYIISRLDSMVDIVDGSEVTNLFVKIFIIIGALMFAKQFPKILEGLGIKLDGGGFTLNPLKKLENDAIGGKQISKGAKMATRPIKGLATAGLVGGAALATGQGFRGIGRAFSGAMKGEKFGKNFSSSYSAARARKKQVDEMRADGVTPGEVRRANLWNKFHGTSKAEQVQQVENKAKAVQSYYDNIKNQAIACDSNDNSYTYVTDENGNRVRRQTKSAKTLSKELEEMKKTQINRDSFRDIDGISAQQKYQVAVQNKDDEIAVARQQLNELRSQAIDTSKPFAEQIRERDIQSKLEEIERLESEKSQISEDDFDDTVGKTADEQYAEAIEKQKETIKAKEGELEARINDLANNNVYYEDSTGVEHTGTGVDSADKVIEESKETMIKLAKSVNETGKSIDSEFKDMFEPTAEDIENDNIDVVKMMKTSKGAVAQTTSGKMSDIKDVAKYTNKPKGS